MGTYRAVIERGTLRAMVPFELSYPCTRCGLRHPADGAAVFDTGSPYTVICAAALPEGHVTWEDLDVTGNKMRSLFGPTEYRWWYTDITVQGVTVAHRIKVAEGDYPDVPFFGMEDMGKAFRIGLDWGNPAGPRMHLEPYPATSAIVAPDPRFEPIAMQDMDLIRYHDQSYRLSQDLTAMGFVKEWPFLPPPPLAVDAPSPLPRLEAHRMRPNRQQRRRAVRTRS